jgi:hypothetical protein
MAVEESFLKVGGTIELLNTVKVSQSDGTEVHNEVIDHGNWISASVADAGSTAGNSRVAATLAAAGTFQGVSEDVGRFGRMGVSFKSWVIADAPTIEDIVDVALGDTEAIQVVLKHVENAELTPKQAKTVETLAPVEFEAHSQRSQDTLRAIASDRRRLTKLIGILRQAAQDEEEAVLIALLLAL